MESKTETNLTFQEELKRLLPGPAVLAAWLVVGGVFVWSYWYSIEHLVATWCGTDDYQHGFVVPIFSLFLLWHRRSMMPSGTGRGNLWGLLLFAVWALMQWVAVYFNYGTLPELAILPFFAGVALFVGGWQGLLWSWPAIAFLAFMIPLPGAVQDLAREQLQRIATHLSVFIIQTLGIPADARGIVIQLVDRPLKVEEACSGLRMLSLFFAICVGAAFIVRKPLWERLVMVASALPIAVASNAMRVVLTAVCFDIARRWPSIIDADAWGTTFHDWAGWTMMPIGLVLLLIEMTLLSRLMIASTSDRPLVASQALRGAETIPTTERLPSRRRR